MALRSRFGYRTPIPSITTAKAQTKSFSFKDGVDAYSDNDDVQSTALIYATDARMVKKGRYRTRKGASRYSVPVGEAVSASQTNTSGANVQIVSGSRAVAEKLTVTSTGGVTMVETRVRSAGSSIGSLLVELYTNVSNAPGVLIARSSIAGSSINATFAYLPSYFIAAPAMTSGDTVWVVIRGQDEMVGDYEVSTTTASSNAAYRDGETTWVTAAYSLNTRLSIAPLTPVKGRPYRAYRSNGLAVTLFVAGSTLYSVNDVTGATTALYTSLNAAAARYRFDMAQDAVYFTDDGLSKPYKLDLTTMTVSVVTAAPEVSHLAVEHKGLMFYGNAVDRSQVYFSNFGQYDKFTSTDFLTIMAPKSPYRHTALAKLNGALYVFANKNKYLVLGDSNATWSQDEATDQRGTFSQESVAYNENYIFHADDDGVHQFNGTESVNLAEPFLEEYKAIQNKGAITLEIFNNRLYVFYAPAGQPVNTECFVINLLLKVYEGKDLNQYIGGTFARFSQDNVYIQSSNRVAALYYGEAAANNYDNLGGQLQFELRTSYGHFDSPSQFKRVPKWRPVFEPVSGQYSVDVAYAKDGQTDIADSDWLKVDLGSNNPRYNTGLLFDSGVRFATPGTSVEPQDLFISGEFKRVQRRFRKIAAHQPVEMDSEVMTVETQRVL